MANECRCSECGFLTLKRNSGEIVAADAKVRSMCRVSMADGSPVAQFLCWKDLAEFSHKRPKGEPEVTQFIQDIKVEIDKLRECGAFIKWNKAKSPEEHEKMIELAILRETQRQDRIAADRGFWINVLLLVATAIAAVFDDQISGYFFPEQPVKQADTSET